MYDTIPTGSQVTITIGRNIADVPMDDSRWLRFQRKVVAHADRHVAPTMTFGPFYGTGIWEGVTEESAVLIFVSGKDDDSTCFGDELAELSDRFEQDAIAWSFGPNNLAVRP